MSSRITAAYEAAAVESVLSKICLPTGWSMRWAFFLPPVPANEIKELANQLGDTSTLQPINGSEDQWHIVPSVMERIQDLVRGLPHSHSAHSLLQELVTDLQDERSFLLSEEGITTNNLSTARQEWQALTKAHRLHDQILNRATLSSS
eukprot:CAMPEP_0176022356 /NCGR_PEP_ID=MMETSP0120_2-20121206/10881_1 /TAXON_ID=160619 /ORGANISM="Kryptoperidinium foliaceum, Strain CCMP 1326" /LENGTH=147 /DNA_ID=CAMNT_0017355495 /DNA_START=155 /DNA_END=596 /DNA_ORIENTATION=-